MPNFYLAELTKNDDTPDLVKRFNSESDAIKWAKESLADPEIPGPCEIFLAHERTGECDLIKTIRK